MKLRHFVDEFLNHDRLAHAGAAEDARLTAAGKGRNQVNDLDARHKDLRRGRLFFKRGRAAVDRSMLLRRHNSLAVNRLACDVKEAAQGRRTHRHADGLPQRHGAHPAAQTVGAAHRDTAHCVSAQLLFDLKGLFGTVVHLHQDGVINLRQFTFREDEVHDRSDDALDCSNQFFCHSGPPSPCQSIRAGSG